MTGEVGIAEQDVSAEFEGASGASVVSLISSRPRGGEERIGSIEPMNLAPDVAGFHAKLRAGGDVWYQFAASGSGKLVCGPVAAEAQSLLVVTGQTPGEISGLLLSGKEMTLQGQPVEISKPDIQFVAMGGSLQTTEIDTPVDPVSFSPDRNGFIDQQIVEMKSATPGVEIRYTVDGTPPTSASTLCTGPVTIAHSTEFAARAYRLGPGGKTQECDEFEINGTHFSEPTYAWFYKKPFHPADQIDDKSLEPGLGYDYLEAPWWQLYAEAHWLPSQREGTVDREMDLSSVQTHDSYGMRYKGYLKVPQDGLYTFEAPHELCYMGQRRRATICASTSMTRNGISHNGGMGTEPGQFRSRAASIPFRSTSPTPATRHGESPECGATTRAVGHL